MPTSENRVLIIDDDLELCELVTEYLGSQAFDVEAVQRGEQGVELALSGKYSLVVLDVMLPGIDGFEALRRIRARSAMPVLMLTARGDDVDRIIGLELGADDYLPKPFNPRELAARIRAILRRATLREQATREHAASEHLTVGDVEMDLGTRQVRRDGRLIQLTSAEFDLLEVLLRAAGHVVDRKELFQTVLDRDPLPMDRSIDMHVSHLRRKLGHEHGGVERIKSIRGVGYIYTCVSTDASMTRNETTDALD
ncbi:MAG: response regulator transcription factor [Phycisphaerae bacterium]|nr:response regulator transcription factor [Phycisphaerae bacterium]